MTCLQCSYYVVLLALISIFDYLLSVPISLSQFFDTTLPTYSTLSGCFLSASFVLSGLVVSFIMVFVVGRSREIWDFGITLQGIHVSVCLAYTGTFSLWWTCINIGSCIAMIVLGEILCVRKEVRDIPRTLFGLTSVVY